MKKKKLFIYKNNMILLDGSYIKLTLIKFFKNQQINYIFTKKQKKN